jgi:8-oxo-dGTP pyrophosphatase MutT (NUDIX family)
MANKLTDAFEASDVSEPIHPSATVVLVRDGKEGLEVLLVQRASAVKHMGGMWVFPGGKVDEADHADDQSAYTAAVNAAIRETREEAGLSVRPEQLVFLSHWTTPEGAKKRFATWFFLTILDDGQQVVVDGGEISDHRWVSPAIALREAADESHPLRLMPPTFVSIRDLAECASCGDARKHMSRRDFVYYEPRMAFVEGGICFLYGGDAGYDTVSLEVEGPRHRLYMINDQLDYIREV